MIDDMINSESSFHDPSLESYDQSDVEINILA